MRTTGPNPPEPVPLTGIDLYDLEVYRSSSQHPAWATLRAEAPLWRQDSPAGIPFWSVTRYADVAAVLRDTKRFGSEHGTILAVLPGDPAGGKTINLMDPPKHTWIRIPVIRTMSTAVLQRRGERIREHVREIAAPFFEGGECDFAELMLHLPMTAVGEIIGLPKSLWRQVPYWTVAGVAPEDPEFAVGPRGGGTSGDEAVTVHGREAVLTTLTEPGTADEDDPRDPSRLVAVTWLHEPGQRVAVYGESGEDVLRFAQELTEEPFPAQTPFTFGLMPPGAQLDVTQPNLMMFLSADPPSGDGLLAIQVELLRGEPGMTVHCPEMDPEPIDPPNFGECELPREPVQVGAHDGELIGEELVILYLEDGLALRVAVAGSLALSDDDLLRFAAGVHVTEHAAPSEH